jgi:predicted AAA+ superfamily ATPase
MKRKKHFYLKILDRELKIESVEDKATAIVGPRRAGKHSF